MKNINVLPYAKKPYAVAVMQGSDIHSQLQGIVKFYQAREGVLVWAYISGLPKSDDMCKQPIFAVHIHSGGSCTGTQTDPFADALTHYNPKNCPHPYHAGDMPSLFGVNGIGFSIFLTNRFTINEIVGKSVIIHSAPDDFTTQPSGNSGQKIACGVIVKVE